MPTNGKPSFLFRDQVNAVSSLFKEWNHCEQTVALYSLLKRITSTQARFLALVLEQSNTESNGFKQLEQQANDPGFVTSLLGKSKETAIEQLLSHLPLLQPGSIEAKKQYLNIIPKILAHSLEGSIHLDECRQLLSYLLIHPALTNDERGSLTYWLGRLDEHANGHGVYPPRVSPEGSPPTYTSNGHYNESRNSNYIHGSKINGWRDSGIGETLSGTLNTYTSSTGKQLAHTPLTYTMSAPPSVHVHVTGSSTPCIPIAGCTTTLNLPHKNNQRNSLTPPECLVQSSMSTQDWFSHEDLETRGSRSLVLPSQCNEHAPLSPQSSTASSASSTETHNEDCGPQTLLQQKSSFVEEGSGMKDVPSWLKTLRLHKYSYLFQQITYQEMLELTEEQLETMNVTKGARHKIVLSIQKLKERQGTLQSLEKDIMSDCNAGTLRNALNEIKTMLGTPIRGYVSENDSFDQFNQDPPSPTDNDQGSSQSVVKGDLSGQITRFMGKMCTQLVMSRRPDEDAIGLYLQLLDKCLNHEAFTNTHKKRLLSWRQSCQKFSSRSPFMRKQSMQDLRSHRTWGHVSNIPIEYKPTPGLRRQRLCYPQPLNQRMPMVIGMGSSGLFRPATNHASNLNYSPHQLSGNHHQGVQRTKSMPVRRMSQPLMTVQHGMQTTELPSTLQEPDINNCLESLCRSVTEIALSDGPDHPLDPVGN